MFSKFILIGIISLVLTACTSETGVRPELATALQQDFAILARTKELISSEARWNRSGEQSCPRNANSWSLFCALMQASRDITGDFQLRRPALNQVRNAIGEVAGKKFERRLLDFNSDPNTTFAHIRQVLNRATERLGNSRR